MNNDKFCLFLLYTFTHAEYSTSTTIIFLDKLLKGTQHDSVIHHSSKFIYSAKNHGSQNSDFITNVIYKVYSKHPSGWLLVYSYRLLYEPNARVARPHGSLVPPKWSGPPAPGWSRPQASTTHLSQSTLPTTPWPTCLTLADWGVDVRQRFISPITVDDRSSRPMQRSSASFGPTSFGYPLSSRERSTRG